MHAGKTFPFHFAVKFSEVDPLEDAIQNVVWLPSVTLPITAIQQRRSVFVS